MLAGLGNLPPASPLNFTSWALVGFIFQYLVRRKRFTWWAKYNCASIPCVRVSFCPNVNWAPQMYYPPRWTRDRPSRRCSYTSGECWHFLTMLADDHLSTACSFPRTAGSASVFRTGGATPST
jgi:hypothetical protein